MTTLTAGPTPAQPAPAPQRQLRIARGAGVLYLVIIVMGIFAQMFVRANVTVGDSAAATVANLQDPSRMFRAGIAADAIMILADVALAIAFFALFAHVSRAISLLAAVFRLTQAAILGANLVNLVLALLLATGASLPGALGGPGRDELALLFLRAHAVGYAIALLFFAASLLVLAYLVLRSRLLPRVFTWLLGFAAAGYLLDGFAQILLAEYARYAEVLGMVVFGPAVVGEVALALWLLVRGVRVPPETRRTAAAMAGA